MTALYQLSAEYAALQAAAEDGADVEAQLAALTDSLEIKAERIGALLRNFDAECEALAAEEKRLAARRKTRENAAESLREYVRRNMVDARITRIKAPQWTFSLRETEHVEVTDIDAVPPEYKRTKTEVAVAKKDVLDAWRKSGEVVPGAAVVTNTCLIVK